MAIQPDQTDTLDEGATDNRSRAAFYIDGFNLFHAIDDLRQPHLKWVDLSRLATRLVIGKPERLERIIYCSAFRTDNHEKADRHRKYVRALRGTGVIERLGYFADDGRECHCCGHSWQQKTEKEGDVSLALAVVEDAYADLFDVAYIVTADGDQAPTFRMVRRLFPEKILVTVAPPGRSHNFKVRDLQGVLKASISAAAVEACLFPRMVQDDQGNAVIRPPAYDPPSGRIAPG